MKVLEINKGNLILNDFIRYLKNQAGNRSFALYGAGRNAKAFIAKFKEHIDISLLVDGYMFGMGLDIDGLAIEPPSAISDEFVIVTPSSPVSIHEIVKFCTAKGIDYVLLPDAILKFTLTDYESNFYYINGEQVHRILDFDKQRDISLTDGITQVSNADEIGDFTLSHSVYIHSEDKDVNDMRNFRKYICNIINPADRVAEFGASGSPFPLKIGCKAEYYDKHLNNEGYQQQRKEGCTFLVPLTDNVSFEDLREIPGEFDYILSSHCIEHTINPIKCICSAYEKLRGGGGSLSR